MLIFSFTGAHYNVWYVGPVGHCRGHRASSSSIVKPVTDREQRVL